MRLMPGPLARMLPSAQWAADVFADGLMVDGRLIPWEAITEVRRAWRVLFTHIDLEVGGRTIRLAGLPRRRRDNLVLLFKSARYPKLIDGMVHALGVGKRFVPLQLLDRLDPPYRS